MTASPDHGPQPSPGRPETSPPTIGFVGTGRMGAPMCRNLLARGYPLVVHNRTPSKAEALVADGATVAESVEGLVAQCEVLITCLDTVRASEMMWDWLVALARPGTLLIEHGTIPPALARRTASFARERGLDYVDAPVSGGPEGATRGTLAIMVGGTSEAVDRARPILSAYGGTIQHMGEAGTGTQAKLVNQLLTFVHGLAAAEAIAFAQRGGLDLERLSRVLQVSFGHSRMLDRTLGRVRDGNYDAGAALRLFEKDLQIIADAARELDIQLPLVAVARGWLTLAKEEGLADRDIAALRLLYPAA